MKKNIFLLVSVILFVALFYHQGVAVNFSIFSSVLWGLLVYAIPANNRGNIFWVLSATLLLTILSFAWYGDFLSFLALGATVLLLGYKAWNPALKLITFPVGLVYNYASMIIRVPFVHQWLPLKGPTGSRLIKNIFLNVLVPLCFVSVFFAVYTATSNKFASLFAWKWNMDYAQLVVLTVLGFIASFGYFHYAVPKELVSLNSRLAEDFGAGTPSWLAKGIPFWGGASQKRSGEITLVLLNTLLVFFIIIYGSEQFGTRASAGTLSSAVHERTYALIGSIVMAVAVIMLFFNGTLHFDAKAKLLKTLAYLWIGLNTVLMVIVCMKNTEYVLAFGLTFKRIGVFVFLMISLVGLIITTLKIYLKRTNIFLMDRMAWALYVVLMVCSFINWSGVVTKYNISHFASPDWAYLQKLTYNKQLLYNASRLSAENVQSVQREKQRPFLSKSLYYRFLNIRP